MTERLELAIALARQAGELQRRGLGKTRQIETKSSAIDLVTDVDRACDELLIAGIAGAFPEDGILTEETGCAREGRGEHRWVIDPLDGTTNYAHGFPHFAVSVAVERAGERAIGVIYDPIRDELFSAERDTGARCNDREIRVSATQRLEQALLATGFSYDVHDSQELPNLDYFARLLRSARAIRRAGSAALDLAYVACGRLDGFWELELGPWDVAAGMLLVEEAGGTLSDLDGSPAPASGKRLLASNGPLHPALLQTLG